MASYGESRMYESKYPEVDDVVMVQVCVCADQRQELCVSMLNRFAIVVTHQ